MRKKSTLSKLIYKYKYQYLIGIILLILVDIILMQIPLITRDITDSIRYGNVNMSDIVAKSINILFAGVGIVIGRYFWRNFIFGTSRKIEYDLRNAFYKHLETLSMNFYNHHATGDLMAHAVNDLNAIRMMMGPGILTGFDTIIMTMLIFIKMISVISVKLTLLSIIPIPFIAIGSLIFGKIISKKFKDKQEAFSRLTEHVQENIFGIRVVKAFVQEAKEISGFANINNINFNKNINLIKSQIWMMPLARFVAGISITIILGYGGYLTIMGEITLGDFVAFINYLYMLIWPMVAFGWCINLISNGTASLKRYETIMNEVAEIKDDINTNLISSVKGNISINNLTFTYPKAKKESLKNISLNLKQGQTLGIVGRTGSGKTTLINLLLRLYDAEDNSIIINDTNIKKIPLKQLRKAFGYVPQDDFLFSNTIKNNIAFGLDNVTDEQIIEAAKAANVHDNIMDFEKGYNTVVGEKGMTLSGGQKQRISIARALIKNPEILILDDSLSAVDTHTEELILNHIKEMRENKTTIIIAHRISTILHSDRIIVLDEGQIVEQGTHDSLMKEQNIYFNMVRRQQLEKEIEVDE